MSFFQALQECNDIPIVKDKRSLFLISHDMRNAVYHFGTLMPEREEVESAISSAKLLFNALHPNHEFREANVQFPTDQVVEIVLNSRIFVSARVSV
jgi:hypothetical protein